MHQEILYFLKFLNSLGCQSMIFCALISHSVTRSILQYASVVSSSHMHSHW